jgi:hypothetical protein
MNLKIETVASHRNGISGELFYAITFRDESLSRNMVAVVFPNDEGYIRTAVLDRDMVGQGNVKFFENSWRGDYYHRDLCEAISAYEAARQ